MKVMKYYLKILMRDDGKRAVRLFVYRNSYKYEYELVKTWTGKIDCEEYLRYTGQYKQPSLFDSTE